MKDIEVIKLLDEKNKELKNDLKDTLENNFRALMVTLESETNKVSLKVDTVISHNERQNSMLKDHEEAIVSLNKSASACRSNRRVLENIWKSKKWIFIGLVLLIIVVGWVQNKINWERTVEKKFEEYGIVLKEPNDST